MLESMLHSSYISLGVQPVAELEDPPETLHSPWGETLHTPWGVWLHRWDALHSIEQRYDSKHMLRAARAADDILHYANYTPKIGKGEDEIKPNEINFDYNYMHEEFVYDTGTELDEEEDAVDAEANIVVALEEEPIDFGDKNEDTKDNKIENFSDYVKKDLVEIIRTSGLKKSVSSKHKKL